MLAHVRKKKSQKGTTTESCIARPPHAKEKYKHTYYFEMHHTSLIDLYFFLNRMNRGSRQESEGAEEKYEDVAAVSPRRLQGAVQHTCMHACMRPHTD